MYWFVIELDVLARRNVYRYDWQLTLCFVPKRGCVKT
jgi:hypothetical protein